MEEDPQNKAHLTRRTSTLPYNQVSARGYVWLPLHDLCWLPKAVHRWGKEKHNAALASVTIVFD